MDFWLSQLKDLPVGATSTIRTYLAKNRKNEPQFQRKDLIEVRRKSGIVKKLLLGDCICMTK
jgi:hypothetical protein